MIGRSNDQAVTLVLFQKLQKRVQHPPNFADVLAFAAPRADRIEFVEEVDAASRLHGVEQKRSALSGVLSVSISKSARITGA
jgi:hypothetical protein